ncbi:polysaccharide lyase family 7 protein [Asticcacaulis sp. AC402]|uniref:polysaccharide lyase family 7 protein n=1 Tax=Asticcacaulis sp. AC402 TaxID=1282361 RepID=UPI0004115760|nr:polysaccharide lyase family 7 protein [Asticcacaulis sp. AC402]
MSFNSDHFDLTKWKLTVPVDRQGSTSGTAETIHDLTQYADPLYFYVSTDGAMIFSAPVDGATTPGSNYARCELRELIDGEPAAWQPRDGGTLTATLAVNRCPTLGDERLAKVVIGQVHGTSDELVRLYYDSGTVYFVNDRAGANNTETRFELRNAANQSCSIDIGEKFSYKIDVQGEWLTVEVYADDQTYSITTAVNSVWENDDLYFKAGIYLGANETTATGTGEVAFYGLDFGHAPGEGLEGLVSIAIPQASVDLSGGVNNDNLNGGIASDLLSGDGGNDIVNGNGGTDSLYGGDGDDWLNGGNEADSLWGGSGNDTYLVDHTDDRITENSDPDGGMDKVLATVTYTLADDVETLVLMGSGDIHATGNSQDNALFGNAGANRMEGGPGADTMRGGGGHDTYVVDAATDNVIELASSGKDLVISYVDLQLGDYVETLSLTGDAVSGVGNGLDNALTGNSGNNRLSGGMGVDSLDGGIGDDELDGGTGDDRLVGGQGDDSFAVDSRGDVVVEAAGQGSDTVFSAVSYELRNHVENLVLMGAADIDGTGNGLGNLIEGNVGHNALTGGSGVDRLSGGAGDDRLAGLGSDDVLDGGTGNNVLEGGAGNDRFVFEFHPGSESSPPAIDVITDFEGAGLPGGDLIHLPSLYDNRPLVLNLTEHAGPFADAPGIAATLLAPEFIGDHLIDVSWYQNVALSRVEVWVDGNDDGQFSPGDLLVCLNGASSLTTGDFVDNLLGWRGTALGDAQAFNDLPNLGFGGGGDDSLSGGLGRDALYGGDDNDQLNGDAGNDDLRGDAGDDTLSGGDDGDDLFDNSGFNSLNGGDGNDNLFGTGTLSGDTGDDVLASGWADGTQLFGGDGDDVLQVGTVSSSDGPFDGFQSATGGAGADLFYVTGWSPGWSQAQQIERVLDFNSAEGDRLGLFGISHGMTMGGEDGNPETPGPWGVAGATLLFRGQMDALNFAYGASLPGDDVGLGFVQAWYTHFGGAMYLVVDGNGNLVFDESDVAVEFAGNSQTTLSQGDFVADTFVAVALSQASDMFVATDGDDRVYGVSGHDTLDGAAGDDELLGGSGHDLVTGNPGNDVLHGADGDDTLAGEDDRDTLNGGDGDDVLDGGSNDDLLKGGNGSDTASFVSAPFAVQVDLSINGAQPTGGGGSDALESIENLTGSDYNDSLTGDGGDNRLDGGLGDDTLSGGDGRDIASYGAAGAAVTVSLLLQNQAQNTLALGMDHLVGMEGLSGSAYHDTLTGDSGGNWLDGGGGVDRLIGSGGNDTYYVDNPADNVVENHLAGMDLIVSSISYSLAGRAVESLTLTGEANLNATGNGLANILTGNAGANLLDGGLGADTYAGGLGDDTFAVDHVQDLTQEVEADAGIDTVIASVSYKLFDTGTEVLTLTGAGNLNATGNVAGNTLIGTIGNNRLDGGAGVDTLSGGLGNDTYIVDVTGDVVVEGADSGIDIVQSSATWTLAANVENLFLTGVAAVDGFGNDLGNLLFGNSAVNTLTGGLGDDTYVVTDGDLVVEAAGAGKDTVQSGRTWTLAENLENLTLTGSEAVDGFGNALNNYLSGNTAVNVLTGGLGDDSYKVHTSSDVVVENSGEGTDTVFAIANFTLSANIENLTLIGINHVTATGNGLNNVLIGNTGINTLTGGLGDDTYYIQNATDTIIEQHLQGTDTVFSSVSYSLFARAIETLILQGTEALTATGNSLANSLTGNAGDNILIGGGGNDTYTVQNSGDSTVENANEGMDTVLSSISWTLGNNVENLTLIGINHVNATGNALNNVLTGNGGINTLTGGLGDDTYYVQNATDTVVEQHLQGTDLIYATVTYSLFGRAVEALILTGAADLNATGNSLANTLTGNSGANTLDGRAGNDLLTGGLGADVFLFGTASGTDMVGDFSATQNDTINVNAHTGGVANVALVTQVGMDVVINLGGGNIITVLSATQTDVISQMIW